jgi:hypothetical protein
MIVHQIWFQTLLFVHVINDFVEEVLHDHYQAFEEKEKVLLSYENRLLLFVIRFQGLQYVVHISLDRLIRYQLQSVNVRGENLVH